MLQYIQKLLGCLYVNYNVGSLSQTYVYLITDEIAVATQAWILGVFFLKKHFCT